MQELLLFNVKFYLLSKSQKAHRYTMDNSSRNSKKPFVIKGLAAEGCFQRSLFVNIFAFV